LHTPAPTTGRQGPFSPGNTTSGFLPLVEEEEDELELDPTPAPVTSGESERVETSKTAGCVDPLIGSSKVLETTTN